MTATITSHSRTRSYRQWDTASVLRELESLHGSMVVGEQFPSHRELMRRLGASERSVARALDELARQGKIIKRLGRGRTVVADPGLANASHGTSRREVEVTTASSLTTSHSVVAVAYPDRAFFERAMSLLFRHTMAADLSLNCQMVDPENISLQLPASGQEPPLGYVVFGRVLIPAAQQLQAAGQRVVLVGTPYADTIPGVPTVQGDQEQGGYLAARHLLDLGHRHITYFGPDDWPQVQRYRGHQQALHEARKQGHSVDESHIDFEEFSRWRDTPERAVAYFSRPDAPTAIVAWNDHEAMVLLSLLSYAGIRVPQDVSIIGYDNLPEGQKVHPLLTTVDAGVEQQLQAAVKLLTQPAPPSPLSTVIVLPTLLPRESTTPPSFT